MRKFLLALFLLAAVGVGAWRIFAPTPAPKNPIERMKAGSPLEAITAPKQAAPIFRETTKSSKVETKRTQMEERFTDLKEEGRRIREMLMASDPNAAKAFQALGQRPEYREVIDRRHQIENAWANAPESEREGMLNEMNSLRQQGIGMLLAEIQRMKSQPEGGTTIQQTGTGTLTLTPSSGAAPAPAPAPPVVFQ
jgi:hypothetical protein